MKSNGVRSGDLGGYSLVHLCQSITLAKGCSKIVSHCKENRVVHHLVEIRKCYHSLHSVTSPQFHYVKVCSKKRRANTPCLQIKLGIHKTLDYPCYAVSFYEGFQASQLHIVTADISWLIIVPTRVESSIQLILKSDTWKSQLGKFLFLLYKFQYWVSLSFLK